MRKKPSAQQATAKLAAALRERKEALEQQAATAEILKVIARSPSDVQPVFDTIARSAVRLCRALFGFVGRFDGENLHLAAQHNFPRAALEIAKRAYPSVPNRTRGAGRAILTKSVVRIEDIYRDPAYYKAYGKKGGWRRVLAVPMMRNRVPLGVISVSWADPGPIPKNQVELLKTFAEQAVIAIENARLFNETKEALEHQKASTDILRIVAGSVNDTAPTFEAILKSMRWLFRGFDATVWMLEGGQVMAVARGGKTLLRHAWQPRPLSRDFVAGITILERRAMRFDDVAAARGIGTEVKKSLLSRERRALLMVPLLREGKAIGAISVSSSRPTRFSDKQQALLENFADQAVIAIENARLFNETKEALEHQKASGNILGIIAASVESTDPVFEAITAAAMRLVPGSRAALFLERDGQLHRTSHRGLPDDRTKALAKFFPAAPDRTMVAWVAVLERRTIHVPDIMKEARRYKRSVEIARTSGYKGDLLCVPLMQGKRAIGALSMARSHPGSYSEKEITLIKTFASQAVIALRNARSFTDTREALEREKASAGVLRVIAGSPRDVQPVFDSIARDSLKLMGGLSASVVLVAGDQVHLAAFTTISKAGDDALRKRFPAPVTRPGAIGRALQTGKPSYTADTESDFSLPPALRETGRVRGFRSLVSVPMIVGGRPIGAITVSHKQVGAFNEHQIGLLGTFADQAVIAIENARLFNETKEALEQQTATAEILRVISGSPTDVQPVFEAIVRSAARLFPPCNVTIVMRAGDVVNRMASAGPDARKIDRDKVASIYPLPFDRKRSVAARSMIERRIIEILDTEAAGLPGIVKRLSRAVGYRAITIVPLIREGEGIGAIGLSRPEPGFKLSDKQLSLVRTFADQAVIAIENVRLFNETKEALEQQKASSEVLSVISGSVEDARPVFNAIVSACSRLFECHVVGINVLKGDRYRLVASTGATESQLVEVQTFADQLSHNYPRFSLRGRPAQFPDIAAPDVPEVVRRSMPIVGAKACLFAPLRSDGRSIGAIWMGRAKPGAFSEGEVALLQSFADQAVVAIKNARLFNETKEALEQQTASAEILRVISSTPTDTQPVFKAIVDATQRLIGGKRAALLLRMGSRFRMVAHSRMTLEGSNEEEQTVPLDREKNFPSRAILDGEIVHVTDWEAEDVPEFERYIAKTRGIRSGVLVPLVRKGQGIGALAVARETAGPYHEKEIALLRSFADQAVIAIENTRLFNETKESLERQTATADILKVIASSPADIQPVFDAIASSAKQLLGGFSGVVTRVIGDKQHLAAYTKSGLPGDDAIAKLFPAGIGDLNSGRAITSLAPAIRVDTESDPDITPTALANARTRGYRSLIAVPMIRDGRAIGSISVTRREPGSFSADQIELLETFADQAVIAVENVRLFNETKEALEKETATAEILKVLSGSPSDTQPVFDAIVRHAARLCESTYANVFRYDGELLHAAASEGGSEETRLALARSFPAAPNPSRVVGRVIRTGDAVHVEDTLADAEYDKAFAATLQRRRILGVPLVRGGKPIGAITVGWDSAGPILRRHEDLLKTFADQAVVAIENVRLFNETKEALERQTATAEILKVIASSPSDVQPVFDTIVKSALSLCKGMYANVFRYDGELLHFMATESLVPRDVELMRTKYPMRPDASQAAGRVILSGAVVRIEDVSRDPDYDPRLVVTVGPRSMLAVPMMREGAPVGVIVVAWGETGSISKHHEELLQTFADQAVIAIENVRLFNETKEALERQTATAEILKVISGSPIDVQPVFNAIVESCFRLFRVGRVTLWLVADDRIEARARKAANAEKAGSYTHTPLDQTSGVGRCVVDSRMIHVPDLLAAADELPRAKELGLSLGYRAALFAPLLRDGKAIGAISLLRPEPGPFTDREIGLLQTFADQAVIAIENVRLFNETKEALERQTATAEILKVISGSITDARPVFDAISRSVLRLYGARTVSLVVRVGERIDRVGYALADKSADDGSQALWPIPLDDKSLSGRAILSGELVHIKDVDTEPGLSEHSRAITQQTGVRSALIAPMYSMGAATGALAVGRRAAGGFSEREVEMIRTFADQAVIAMENVRLFREIQEKSAQLEEASQHKSQFLASMSHELRTPLNALLGFNEMLLGDVYGEVPGDMKPPLAQMQASGKHLLRLINNVLDLAKIEAGRMELALAEYSVHDTVESVRSTLQPLAADKRLDFRAAVPAEIPLAYGDPGRIAQCLMNLAGNSLKFTKAGKVEISVAMDNGLLRYRVADTGVGIPPDKIDGLFTEFKQTDATIASEYGGTGLGLSISKKFVEMHGGRIWAESEPGRGSVFTFEVPLRVRGAGAAA